MHLIVYKYESICVECAIRDVLTKSVFPQLIESILKRINDIAFVIDENITLSKILKLIGQPDGRT